MANRRMFSNRIANSAKFLQMPAESQLLYFHMVQRADDDGVVEAYPLLKLLGLAPDNYKLLIAKGYITSLNEDQVIVVMDWSEHNNIRADRKVDSIYKNLLLEKVPALRLVEPRPRADVEDNSRRIGGQSTDGIGKVRIGKDSTSHSESEKSLSQKVPPQQLASLVQKVVPTTPDGELIPRKPKKAPKSLIVRDGRIDNIISMWNKYPQASILGKGKVPNSLAEKELLPIATSNFSLDKRIKDRVRFFPNLSQWETAIKKYVEDIINRDPTQQYAQHRMSLYDFVNQKNGFLKFVNR